MGHVDGAVSLDDEPGNGVIEGTGCGDDRAVGVFRIGGPVMSVPTPNSSVMDPRLSCDWEFISITPSTDLRYSSCSSMISFSISSGEAPAQNVVIVIAGR
jgi:hypothetical protein